MLENRKTEGARLHLYQGTDIIAWLKNGCLPLESSAGLTYPFVQFDQWQGEHNRPLSQEALDLEWLRQYRALPEAVRGLLSFEHFKTQGGEIEDNVRAAARRHQNGQQAHFDTGWLGQARLLRLFPSALCYYGWRQLAEDFSGFALVLNSRHATFASSKERPSKLAPVRYGQPYRFKVTADNPFPGLLEDHGSQRDNQEWRLLMPAKTAARHQGRPVLSVGRGLIESIYWSVATPEESIEALRTLIKQDMRYRSVKLGRVVPDAHQWQLSFQEMT